MAKHKDRTKKWQDSCLWEGMNDENQAHVYVLQNDCDQVYTGSSSQKPSVRLSQHNQGGVTSTKRKLKGGWRHAVLITGFRSPTAASRFEALVKSKGRAAGVKPKLDAAMAAIQGNEMYGKHLVVQTPDARSQANCGGQPSSSHQFV